MCERMENLCNTRKKSSVEIDHAKESLQATYILRVRLLEECFNMTAEWNDSCGSNLVNKIINFWERKTTFLKVDDQTILHQELGQLRQLGDASDEDLDHGSPPECHQDE